MSFAPSPTTTTRPETEPTLTRTSRSFGGHRQTTRCFDPFIELAYDRRTLKKGVPGCDASVDDKTNTGLLSFQSVRSDLWADAVAVPEPPGASGSGTYRPLGMRKPTRRSRNLRRRRRRLGGCSNRRLHSRPAATAGQRNSGKRFLEADTPRGERSLRCRSLKSCFTLHAPDRERHTAKR